jgi:hypothetical protein
MTKPKRSVRGASAALTAQDMAEVMRRMMRRVRQDDPTAMHAIERHWRLSARPVRLDLPPITDAKSVAEAQARVIAASTDGETLTTRQGLDLSTMIEYRRRALEAVEFEAELRDIEAHDAKAIEDGPKKRRW